MKPVHQVCALALLGGGLFVASAAAQNAPAPPPQQSAPADNPYTGVSNPPPDDTIVATPDIPPPPPAAKPSPAMPVQPAAAPVPPPPPAPAVSHHSDDPNSYDGTDYGIVTPGSGSDSQSDSSIPAGAAQLHNRYNPDEDVVNVVPSVSNALSEGTNIRIRLLQTLSTNTTEEGSPFRGAIVADVYREGRVIIPAGAELRGRVTSSHPGHHLGSRATLRLTPDLVLLPDGTAYHLHAQVVYADAPNTRTTDEGAVQPNVHLKKDAAEYGVGVGAGVLAGAQFGPEGALVGSLVGAGIITAHLLVQHPDAVELPRNADVTFSLTEPMELTPSRN